MPVQKLSSRVTWQAEDANRATPALHA